MDIVLKDIFIDSSPNKYLPSEALKQAVEIAYALKRPLLLSGEPGTGKTEFARWVAYTLASKGFADTPIVYNTKSSSTAQDLFYSYDAVAHFRETNINTGKDPNTPQKTTEDFIELRGLGLAFANALGSSNAQLNATIATRSKVTEAPSGSVVLIDEIDKAARDFPNDLLNELERYEFDIKEINKSISLSGDNAAARKNILIILTSNFEKSLPEPFLRRCIYYHIEFPDRDSILKIITSRLRIPDGELKNLNDRIDEFFKIRANDAVQKKPSTAEAIDYMRALNEDNMLGKSLYENDRIKAGSELLRYLPILLKRKEDILLYRNSK